MAVSYRVQKTDVKNKAYFAKAQDTKKLMEKIGAAGHSIIVGRVKKGVKPANAPLTKDIKRGDRTLMDNGLMINSINWRANESEAIVSSNNKAAIINNPDDDRIYYEIVPKKARWLTIPAGWNTRTLMRRYGFSPREVIAGLQKDGYSVYRPYKKGSKTVKAKVIMAKLKGSRKLSSGRMSKAKRFQAFPVFYLSKKIRVPIRRFMYLDETDFITLDKIVEDYFK